MSRCNAVVVVLALSLLFAFATVGCYSSEPPLGVASDVDLSRFQGKWYEVARLPRSTQTDCNGTTAFYTQKSDGSLSFVNQCNLGSSTGPLNTVSMTASVPDPSVTSKLALKVGLYTGDYWILEVGSNYEYAVIGHPSRLYWWLLSRTPSLDEATVQAVIARAKSEEFDVSQIKYTPQPPAGERNTLTTPEGPVPAPLSTGCSTVPGRSSGERGSGSAAVFLALAFWAMRSRSRATQNA